MEADVGYEKLLEAATAIADLSGRATHEAALVLGSGLGDYAAALPDAVAIPYTDIPHFPSPKVAPSCPRSPQRKAPVTRAFRFPSRRSASGSSIN